MSALGNLAGGIGVGFGILTIITVSNILTSYVLPNKQTMQEFIGTRLQSGSQAVVGVVA